MKRVVVTGLGLVSPLGASLQTSWSRLLNSESGIRKIPDSYFDTSDLATKIAGLVPTKEEGGLDLDLYIPPKDQRKMDQFIHYGIAAAKQAIEDSGWKAVTDEEAEYTGVIIGSGIGGLVTIYENSLILEEKGPRRISPFFIPASLINLASGHISIEHNFKGPNHSVVTACATGAHAVGDAARLIACGEAKVMIAGGAESSVSRIGIAGFNACRTLATSFNDDPTKASRPWDKGREGFVMGDGAGAMVLEEYEHAVKRGAKIYAEVLGFGYTGDAYHITSPAENGDGGYRAMKIALHKAQKNTSDIGYINAHGTSTPVGDPIEFGAVHRLFEGENVSMSSTKSAIGHLLGAAGSVEAVFSVCTLRDNVMPPTLNLDNPDCTGIDLVPNHAKEKKLNYVISNSFGFGGTNVSLVFGRV